MDCESFRIIHHLLLEERPRVLQTTKQNYKAAKHLFRCLWYLIFRMVCAYRQLFSVACFKPVLIEY